MHRATVSEPPTKVMAKQANTNHDGPPHRSLALHLCPRVRLAERQRARPFGSWETNPIYVHCEMPTDGEDAMSTHCGNLYVIFRAKPCSLPTGCRQAQALAAFAGLSGLAGLSGFAGYRAARARLPGVQG